MSVITEYVAPPVNTDIYDWLAYMDGCAEDGPYGRGASEIDAVKSLCEHLHDTWRGLTTKDGK